MKMKDWAMIGVGMGAMFMYQKYGTEYVDKAKKAINKEINMIKNEINQMMQ